MPGVTTCLDLPYPTGTDPINVAADIQALAVAVDDALCSATVIRLGVIVAWWDNGGTPPIGTLRCNGAPFDPAIYRSWRTTWVHRTPLIFEASSCVAPTPQAVRSQGTGRWVVGLTPSWRSTTTRTRHTTTPSTTTTPTTSSPVVDHQHTINHGHAPASSAGAGSHVHGGLFMGGKVNGFTNQTARGANYGGDLAGDLNASVAADGWHAHTTYTTDMAGSSGSVGHAHNVDLPTYTGVSSLLSSGPTSDAGAPATNRNIPPFMNVTYIIQAVAAPN